MQLPAHYRPPLTARPCALGRVRPSGDHALQEDWEALVMQDVLCLFMIFVLDWYVVRTIQIAPIHLTHTFDDVSSLAA